MYLVTEQEVNHGLFNLSESEANDKALAIFRDIDGLLANPSSPDIKPFTDDYKEADGFLKQLKQKVKSKLTKANVHDRFKVSKLTLN